jgi:hypothetical protein
MTGRPRCRIGVVRRGLDRRDRFPPALGEGAADEAASEADVRLERQDGDSGRTVRQGEPGL